LIEENENLKKELDNFAAITSNLFSKFRVIFYSSPIKRMFVQLADKSNSEPFSFQVNNDNIIYLIPQADKIALVCGIHFNNKTDVSLAKVFCQELEESKRHVRNLVESKYYPDVNKAPIEIKEVEFNPKRFSNGFLVFSK
jgi:actin related protein 2/3 complex subunit 2